MKIFRDLKLCGCEKYQENIYYEVFCSNRDLILEIEDDKTGHDIEVEVLANGRCIGLLPGDFGEFADKLMVDGIKLGANIFRANLRRNEMGFLIPAINIYAPDGSHAGRGDE